MNVTAQIKIQSLEYMRDILLYTTCVVNLDLTVVIYTGICVFKCQTYTKAYSFEALKSSVDGT